MRLLVLYLFFLGITAPLFSTGQITFNTDSTLPSIFIRFCSSADRKIDKPIHLDWVEKDKDIIANKLEKLPAVASSLAGIKKIIPEFLTGNCNCNSSTYDLGYGLTTTYYQVYGGYGSCSADALYFGDQVIQLRLSISNYPEIVENYLLDVIKLPFDCKDDVIVYEKKYLQNLDKYIQDSGRLFLTSADTNIRRRTAINYFTDILSSHNFQEPYYIPYGLGAETFNNLRYFIVNNDHAALENILFSSSPTSRLFAARTLLYMQDKLNYQPGNKAAQRIKQEIAAAKIISSGILSCWVGKFDFDYYDIVKDFEKLLLSK